MNNLANYLTIFRIFLVPFLVASLFYYSPERSSLRVAALAAFAVACLTDALDGWLARRLNQISEIGAYLDPIADKLLLLAGFVCLSFMGNLPEEMRVPAWLTLTVITRDVIILTGAASIFLTTGKLHPQPLWVGKATTFFQMATLLAALLSAPAPFRPALNALTFVLTVASGFSYIRMGGRLLSR